MSLKIELMMMTNFVTSIISGYRKRKMTANNICKHCGLTLQGMENEGEDICVDCLADLCFPSSYSTIEGCIRQSLKLPLTDKEKEDEQCQ
jgi:hypothetical protein